MRTAPKTKHDVRRRTRRGEYQQRSFEQDSLWRERRRERKWEREGAVQCPRYTLCAANQNILVLAAVKLREFWQYTRYLNSKFTACQSVILNQI